MQIRIDTNRISSYLNRVIKDERSKYNFLKQAGIEGENQLMAAAYPISVTNELSRSIGHEVISNTKVSIHADAKYAEIAMETGRMPGSPPPVAAISIWAAKRGLPTGAAFAIAKKIGRSGTMKYRRGGPKLVTEAMEKIEDRIVRKLIPNYLKRYD